MNININDAFLTCGIDVVSLIYALLVFLLFFVKGKSHKISSKVFMWLVIMTIIVALLSITSSVMVANHFSNVNIFARITMFFINCWNYMLIFYVATVFRTDEENREYYSKHPYISYILGFILVLIDLLGCLFLNFEYVRQGEGSPYMFSGALNTFNNVFGVITVIFAFVYIVLYRKKIDKLAIILGIYSIVLCSISIILNATGIAPADGTCFEHAIAVLYLYLSLESQDSLLVSEFQESTRKADEYNKLRSDFIMSMSHELRTPLTSVLGFSDSLINTDYSLEELKEDSKNIYLSSKKLLALINSIIDVSKIESNKETVNAKDYNLDTVIYDISSVINSYITKENLNFTINVDESCCNDLFGDDKKINKILNILLTTSIDHTDYGDVSLNVSSTKIDSANCEIVFHIKNSGHSLSIDDFDRTLDDLIKLASDNDTSIDAKTLNLIVAKSLVDMIGGSIEFINEAGKGTQFIFKLKQKVTSSNVIGSIKEKIQTKHILYHQILDLSGRKVLVVDNKKVNIEIVEKLLKEYSLDIDTSLNPNDALNLFNTNSYDMIFVNDNLGDMSGAQFCDKLNSTGNKVPPIVGLINKSSEDVSIYYDVLDLPIEFRNLNMIMNKVFEKGVDKNEL